MKVELKGQESDASNMIEAFKNMTDVELENVLHSYRKEEAWLAKRISAIIKDQQGRRVDKRLKMEKEDEQKDT